MRILIAICAAALAVSSVPASAGICFKDGKVVCSSDKTGDQRGGWDNHKNG